MTELITHQQPTTDLVGQMDYARAVSAAGILPKAYQGSPGSVLIAMGLGAAMGLSPAESLYRIHVIEGKPSASAELIAANVRRAGHRLRVNGDERRAVAQIIRSDDPEFVYEVEWTIDKAQRAGLAGKGVWKSYPSAMLKNRAITECARTACPEALYGVVYSDDELRDTVEERPAVAPGKASLIQATATVVPEPAAEPEPAPAAAPSQADGPTQAQTRKMGALTKGVSRDDRVEYTGLAIRRAVESWNDVTKAEAAQVIDQLENGVTLDDLRAAVLAPEVVDVDPWDTTPAVEADGDDTFPAEPASS